MVKQNALRVMLVIVGLLFTATIYPLVLFFSKEPALSMMLSLYVTLGILLLLAVRNPSEHRSLIAFTAWSSLAHAGVMGLQAYKHVVGHEEVPGVILLFLIGVILLALFPQRVREKP